MSSYSFPSQCSADHIINQLPTVTPPALNTLTSPFQVLLNNKRRLSRDLGTNQAPMPNTMPKACLRWGKGKRSISYFRLSASDRPKNCCTVAGNPRTIITLPSQWELCWISPHCVCVKKNYVIILEECKELRKDCWVLNENRFTCFMIDCNIFMFNSNNGVLMISIVSVYWLWYKRILSFSWQYHHFVMNILPKLYKTYLADLRRLAGLVAQDSDDLISWVFVCGLPMDLYLQLYVLQPGFVRRNSPRL